jgi:hypothetical protein
MTEARFDGYAERGKALLAQAEDELARGEALQASEKLWGAAAQMVKAVAQTRGWPRGTHRDLFGAVNRLARDLDEPDLRTAFQLASALHTNLYEGWLLPEYVQDSRGAIERLVIRLEALAS